MLSTTSGSVMLLGSSVATAPGEMIVVRIVVGLHFLAQSFGQRARGMLGRAVNHAAGDNLVADRR